MPKLKILFDYSPACRKNKTGIPVFTEQLFNKLNTLDTVSVEKTTCISKFIPLRPWKVYRFFEHILYHNCYLPFKLYWGKYDVYIENKYMFIPLFKPKNTLIVNMVYDIGLILFDDIQTDSHTNNWRKKLPVSISNSDVIITISNSSKNDISKYLMRIGQENKPLHFIYADSTPLAMESKNSKEILSKFLIDEDYFLFIGTLEPRKNPLRLIQAFLLFKQQTQSKVKFVFAGKKGWLYDDVLFFIQQHNLEKDVIFTGYISEEEKMCLLQNTKAFIFLSLYEGFGIPPLEALRLNVPTLLSDIDVFHELFENNALYADPYNIQEIATMLSWILTSPVTINLNSLEKFNWMYSAEKLIDIITKENHKNQ